jgi:DNA-binding transcriptional LysR family regulator
MGKDGIRGMELIQLEMFVAVVEERSFQRAGERVFRSQPAVSIGLQKLEASVGVRLLDRSQRESGRLTAVGEVFYEYASRMLGLRNEALSVLKEDGSYAGSLRIGVTSLDDFESIPRRTRRFHAENPKVRLEISCDRPVNLFRQLNDRRLDIFLLSGQPKTGAQNKNVLVTRMREARPHGSFWTVRRRLGVSALGCAFEESLERQYKTAGATRNARRVELRRLSSAKDSMTDRLVCAENAG